VTIEMCNSSRELETPVSVCWQTLPDVSPLSTSEPVLLSRDIHPIAPAIPVIAPACFAGLAWFALIGSETSPLFALITLLCLVFFGLFVRSAALGGEMTPKRLHRRNFRSILDGCFDIATGRISGWEALWQIAVMPVGVTTGFTVMAVIAGSV
jgi:hypothetical protein